MVADLSYCVGEYVAPHNKANQDKYGDTVVVTNICDDYTKYGKKEPWPQNDTPMIIQAFSAKNQTHFFCTPAFLKPLTKEVK